MTLSEFLFHPYILWEMDKATRVQIPDKTVGISRSANTFEKRMMGRLCSLALIWSLIKEKENSEFKPVKLRSKN